MTVANLSVIVAGYALYLNVKELHGIFTVSIQPLFWRFER